MILVFNIVSSLCLFLYIYKYTFFFIKQISTGTDIVQVIKGGFECSNQYHFTMEPQSCVCIPTEDGIDVYPTSQFIDLTQTSIATCLGIPNNR